MLTSRRLYKNSTMTCRHCGSALKLELIDLGFAPPSNAYLKAAQLREPERHYPLRVLVCEECWLTQTEDFLGHEQLFSSEYAYFSSCSSSWVEHARVYVADMQSRLNLGSKSLVVEIAANDGYLLQHVAARQIPCYGIEPTTSTATAARQQHGLDIVEEFFSRATAQRLLRERGPVDLMVANNVLAHVPDINDFVAGFVILLKETGVATFEFPHLLNLVKGLQFDTIYHEHFSYPSLGSVIKVFATNGLKVFDVEEIPTHGGSLRVYAQRSDNRTHPIQSRVTQLLDKEIAAGMQSRGFYESFQALADQVTFDLVSFLIKCREEKKSVIAYGAAAKGNTLLNYAGIKPNLLRCVYDAAAAKAGSFLPGSHIPIHPSSDFLRNQSDYVLILPWNLTDEIIDLYPQVEERGGRWITAIPHLKVHAKRV
jgi:C-methyltransferase C-terminal domain/Putative zinc binding domain/Methyltransferase domain